jgi:cellulose biosynthesis protein BcsQ
MALINFKIPDEHTAVCVSLINMKGGVGKTTLATQIAWYAVSQMDKKVLLIDLDPQANASQSVMTPQTYVNYLDDGGSRCPTSLSNSRLLAQQAAAQRNLTPRR